MWLIQCHQKRLNLGFKMIRTIILFIFYVFSLNSFAEDKWIVIYPASGPIKETLLNISFVQTNSIGRKFAIIRSETKLKNYIIDIRTEFDCVNKRTRSISSSTIDGEGHFIDGDGNIGPWFHGKDALGLKEICSL